MKTIDQIEKRRRELRFISLALIYFLALVVFGLFFFIDKMAGFFGALQYNVFLRVLFVGLIIGFIFYLAQKERMQSKLTQQLLTEMGGTADRLRKELRYNKFMRDISHLTENLRDDAALERLFSATLKFFGADGGVVVLRNRGTSWKPPLVSTPAEVDETLIAEISKVIGKTGRSFVQPQPEYPDHRSIKSVNSIMAVPLRLENRLYGMIAFWSDTIVFEESDLAVVELVAKETSGSEFNLEQAQERIDQFNGLLDLIASAGDEKAKTKKRTQLVIEQAQAIAAQLGLPPESIEAIETAARLRNVDLVANGSIPGGADSAEIAASLNFPQPVIEALVKTDNGSDGTTETTGAGQLGPINAQILALSELYVTKAFPPRGRRPAVKNVFAKLEPSTSTKFDEKVVAALKKAVGLDSDPAGN